MTDFAKRASASEGNRTPYAASATDLVPTPGRIEHENQVGPGIRHELVVCIEDGSSFVEMALAT